MSTLTRLSEWLSPTTETTDSRMRRLRGHHRYQMAIDTIAYAHNVPVRLLLAERLEELPKVIGALLDEDPIRRILQQEVPELGPDEIPSLANDAKLCVARNWILQLPYRSMPLPSEVSASWLQGLVALLPHIERKVWFSEMGNPLPAHALSRMHDHWALYILMWTWAYAGKFSGGEGMMDDVFGIRCLRAASLPAFSLHSAAGAEYRCVPIVGPVFVSAEADPSAVLHAQATLCECFARFVDNVSEQLSGARARIHAAPSREELSDAVGSRIALTVEEARLRMARVDASLRHFRNASVGDTALLDEMSRADWELAAALCAWVARWSAAVAPRMQPGQRLLITHQNDRIALMATLASTPGKKPSAPQVDLLLINACRAAELPPHQRLQEFLSKAASATASFDASPAPPTAFSIDRPERFVNRLRERQTASWSTLVIGINNLLLKHASPSVEIGSDDFDNTRNGDGDGHARLDAGHLLRGFGGRVCRYLVGMTRADGASIYWLDYSYSPPRLVPAGDYVRYPEHQAESSGGIWQRFDHWAWSEGTDAIPDSEYHRRVDAISQVYRVVATARDDPPESTSASAQARVPDGSGRSRRRIKPWFEGAEKREDEVFAHFACYPSPQPVDSMATPLLVNGRVIGVLSIEGLVEQQFESRLFWPLRRAGALAATCMNHQSQVWHLRRLNYIFSRYNAQKQRGATFGKGTNALRDVSRCLVNIFLCPVANIWLQSASNENRFELMGFSWDHMFPADHGLQVPLTEYEYQPLPVTGPPLRRTFSSLGLDLWRQPVAASSKGARHPALGRFVQGHFDARLPATTAYDAETAATVGIALGSDLVAEDASNAAASFSRRRIFCGIAQGGLALTDIMSFALVRPHGDEWETVGVITLHDKGDVDREALQRARPWDHAWAAVVAQMQTYLPYVFQQAELLFDQETAARRYLMHALRGELNVLAGRLSRVRQSAFNAIGARGKGYELLARMGNADGTPGRGGADLRADLESELKQLWGVIDESSLAVPEQRIRHLANLISDYRTLSSLVGDISAASTLTSVALREIVDQLLRDVGPTLHRKDFKINVVIPSDTQVMAPVEWLRIVLRELLRNVEKYALPTTLTIAWNARKRALQITNEMRRAPGAAPTQRLLEFGYRGTMPWRGITAREQAKLNDMGDGLGLWGAKEICRVLDIEFEVEQIDRKSTEEIPGAGASAPTLSLFIVSLCFPAGMMNVRSPEKRNSQLF